MNSNELHPDGPSDPQLSSRLLMNAEQEVGPALREAVKRLPPPLQAIVKYHFGWTDPQGLPVRRQASKFLRPAWALTMARAIGVSGPPVINASVVLHLMHAFALIHDDIIDGDEFRWGRPTAWSVFGVGQSINAGDALIVLAQQMLLETNEPGTMAAARLLLNTMQGILEGQSIDVAFEGRAEKSLTDWESEAVLKSGVSYGAGPAIVPVLFGASNELVEGLLAYGRELGLSLQASDDVLGIWAKPARNSGRQEGSDIRAGKVTLPMILAMDEEDSDAFELRQLLSAERVTPDDERVGRVRKLIEANGGLEKAVAYSQGHAADLFTIVDDLPTDDECRNDLAELARLCLPEDLSGWPSSLGY